MSIRASLGELGPLGFASYAAARLAEKIPGISWHRYRLIAVPRSAMPAMPRGHVSREMDEAEIASNAAVLELPSVAIRHRLRQGVTCLGAWRGDRLLGVNWLTDKAFDEDEVAIRFALPAGCAWDTGLYVRPEDRGGRAFAALWAGSADWLAARGLDWSLSRIADHNLASWRSHCRMGGRPLGSVSALTLGRSQWTVGTGVATVRKPATVRLREPA